MSDENIEREDNIRQDTLKKKLRTAKASDFQIVQVGEPYPYAASWAGCADIAVFKIKMDCERFIKTFKGTPEGGEETLKVAIESLKALAIADSKKYEDVLFALDSLGEMGWIRKHLPKRAKELFGCGHNKGDPYSPCMECGEECY